ncbi:glycosyltransferase family 2 protein [Candidatus Roizmanbacteria bacterium]|nr:glycosyltransferase family 2 protein [Candidatus Roizmanbacteria bacterium]
MISILIPFYNESYSLLELSKQLQRVLAGEKEKYELIFVDDGSTDGSAERLQSLKTTYHLIRHRKRFGKGKALIDGFNASTGEIILFLDADLQDDPVDIPRFLERIRAGLDFVNGWRINRQDPLSKRLPSAIFNRILLKPFLHSRFHDINCGFKAMRRCVLEEIPLYGDNYRFLPILAHENGFRVGEIKVIHHFRQYGKSKYGLLRLFFGLFDTMTTYFIYRFSERPLHFFGMIGSIFFSIGSLIALNLGYQRIFAGRLLYRRPILLLAILLIIVGVQIIMTGIIAELLVYISQKNKKV